MIAGCRTFTMLVLLAGVAGCGHIQEVAPIEDRPIAAARPATKPAAPKASAAGATAAPSATAPLARESRRKGDERPDSYVVQKGDTLFSIALDFGHDYKELAAWNELADPSVIRVGQRLRLTAPEGADQPVVKALGPKGPVKVEALQGTGGAGPAEGADAAAGVAAAPAVEEPPPVKTITEPKAVTVPYSDKAYAQLGGAVAKPALAEVKPDPAPEVRPEAKITPAPPPVAAPVAAVKEPSDPKPEAKPEPRRDVKEAGVRGADDDHLDWIWPAKGELVYRFGDSGKLKGLGIGGKSGQPVLAAAPGKVVYSGNGLRGYGRLVIIKHNDMFLSVYAHNSRILVKEGEMVKRGQRIAEMGDTDASRVALHFEIRRFGKPVDPATQLPGAAPS